MLKITKNEAPSFWKEYLKKHSGHIYRDLEHTAEGRQVRMDLREHLVKEQHYVCAYCCKRIIPSNALNEHI